MSAILSASQPSTTAALQEVWRVGALLVSESDWFYDWFPGYGYLQGAAMSCHVLPRVLLTLVIAASLTPQGPLQLLGPVLHSLPSFRLNTGLVGI